MKQTKILAALMFCLACAMSSCGSDDDDDINSNGNTVTITVTPAANEDGLLAGDGLTFKITSFADNTVCVYGTTKEVDKQTFTGVFVIPSYIQYNGKRYAVTSIGEHAFFGFGKMSGVLLPTTLIEISSRAFEGCTSLASVTIPSSITEIYDDTFSGCSGLTSVTIPSSITRIGERAFSYCTSLASVTIPNSVTEIGIAAFYGCTSLISVTISSSVKTLGLHAFWGCIKMNEIVCKAITPPVIPLKPEMKDGLVPFDNYNITLIVPTSAVESYMYRFPWCDFSNIQGGAENL